jgi:hypothetical protein
MNLEKREEKEKLMWWSLPTGFGRSVGLHAAQPPRGLERAVSTSTRTSLIRFQHCRLHHISFLSPYQPPALQNSELATSPHPSHHHIIFSILEFK